MRLRPRQIEAFIFLGTLKAGKRRTGERIERAAAIPALVTPETRCVSPQLDMFRLAVSTTRRRSKLRFNERDHLVGRALSLERCH